MKTLNHLFVAAAAVVTFNVAVSAQAGEPFLSPRAAQLRHELRTVPSTGGSPNLVSGNYLGAGAKWELNRAKVVPSGTVTPNLVSGNYNSAALKARGGSLNPQQFEIAPLK